MVPQLPEFGVILGAPRFRSTVMNKKLMAFTAALALSSLAFSAFGARGEDSPKEDPKKEQPLPEREPEPASEGRSPAAIVDAELRAAFKDTYIGLRVSDEKSVFLTFNKGADTEYAANFAREVWMKAAEAQAVYWVPVFEFILVPWTYQSLEEGFAKMRDVLNVKGTTFLDLDENCGCIAVGIADASVAQKVTDFANAAGVWVQVRTEIAAPYVVQQMTLRNQFRPAMGGVQIVNEAGDTCSLGLPVYSFNQGKYGILTASHCTDGTRGDVKPSEIFQAGNGTNQDKLGNELVDAALFALNTDARCTANRTCQYTDVAFVELGFPSQHLVGRVKQPTNRCGAGVTCGLGVTRATDDIRMVGGISGLTMGTTVDKIGRTTGWTSGAIVGTCVDIPVFELDVAGNLVDTMITMLCQSRVRAQSAGGDSGGPVFEFNPRTDSGLFAGVLWGGNGVSFAYSTVDQIDQNFGSFVYNQMGVASPFMTNGLFLTSDVNDRMQVKVEFNVVPADQVRFILCTPSNITQRKELVLVEGPQAGLGRWTLSAGAGTPIAIEGLYTYQLPNGHLEFRKRVGNTFVEVTRVPIDAIPGGTQITFTWLTN